MKSSSSRNYNSGRLHKHHHEYENSMDDSAEDLLSAELLSSIRSKFKKNYFGLPTSSNEQTHLALAYQSRKPISHNYLDDDGSGTVSEPVQEYDRSEIGSRRTASSNEDRKRERDYFAQRKVASALLTMVRNPLTLKHFLSKGGYEAVLKLIHDTKDSEVLHYCGMCLIEVASIHSYCKELLDKNIFSGIAYMTDSADEHIRHLSAIIIALLSVAPEIDELMVMYGALTQIQALLAHAHRSDTVCFLLLGLCNIAPAVVSSDAEIAMRLCFQATKKIDVNRSLHKASFIADVYNNFSRLNHFSSLLVDEGVLPLLLHLIDTHSVDDVFKQCSEAIANLSINRKNRREISISGVASRLPVLFERGSSATRASALLLMGNLLSSNLFHDKVANVNTISNMLDNLFDMHHPRQFNAVSYCLCQLSKNEFSCEVLVHCSVIPIVLGYLREAPHESLDYLWTVLDHISSFPQFFEHIMTHSLKLLTELYEEVKDERSTAHQQLAVVKIALSLSQYTHFPAGLDSKEIELFVNTLKILFASKNSSTQVQMAAIVALINFARNCATSRSIILSNDLIELFNSVGIDDDRMNVKFAELLNVLSNEETCCYRLLDMGAQKFLVTLQDSFQRLAIGSTKGSLDLIKKKNKLKKGHSVENLALMQAASTFANETGRSSNSSSPGRVNTAQSATSTTTNATNTASSWMIALLNANNNSNTANNNAEDADLGGENDVIVEGEKGKAFTAATLHNLALKRPVLAPGVLTMILTLAKNCKTIRVLHCVRTLASMSIHSRSRMALGKEARRVIPMLTVIMRYGCDEAEKVQYFCAIILCNILSLSLEKSLLQELIKTNAIGDLKVVTLLRINALDTKETLFKAFFNLLGRVEIRESLVLQLDLLAVVLELTKLEHVDLLELCVRALYNITCELKADSGVDTAYANKLAQLKIPSMMVSRLVYSPDQPGSLSNRPIRLLLGMSLCNMSFHKQLVVELINSTTNHTSNTNSTTTNNNNSNSQHANQNKDLYNGKGVHKVADAMCRVHALGSEEATYCAVACLFNLSKIKQCKVLADSRALPLLVAMIRGPEAAGFAPLATSTSTATGTAMASATGEKEKDASATGSTSVICLKLAVATICNFSTCPAFHEQMTQPQIGATLVYVLGSPILALSIKQEAVQAVYNLVKQYPPSRQALVDVDVIAALWKFIKVYGGGGSANKEKERAAIAAATEQSTVIAAQDDGELNDEEKLFVLVAHIIRELCEDVSNNKKLLKMMADGVLNIILKLSKVELAVVKADMAFAMYGLCRGQENLKVLKRDAVDILFWLTLHDTLSLHDLILKNVSKAMRACAMGAEEAAQLVKHDRFVPVLKALTKSKNEEVLWETAGMLYNLMQTDACLKRLLAMEKGHSLVKFIFDIAGKGFVSVKHVCSACLHMIPEHIPNVEDPLVLELVLSLLEAQGDRFSQITERPVDILPYNFPEIVQGSLLVHTSTSFTSAWTPFTCHIETSFMPALVPSSPSNGNQVHQIISVHIPPVDPSAVSNTERHGKLVVERYQDLSNHKTSAHNEFLANKNNNNSHENTHHSHHHHHSHKSSKNKESKDKEISNNLNANSNSLSNSLSTFYDYSQDAYDTVVITNDPNYSQSNNPSSKLPALNKQSQLTNMLLHAADLHIQSIQAHNAGDGSSKLSGIPAEQLMNMSLTTPPVEGRAPPHHHHHHHGSKHNKHHNKHAHFSDQTQKTPQYQAPPQQSQQHTSRPATIQQSHSTTSLPLLQGPAALPVNTVEAIQSSILKHSASLHQLAADDLQRKKMNIMASTSPQKVNSKTKAIAAATTLDAMSTLSSSNFSFKPSKHADTTGNNYDKHLSTKQLLSLTMTTQSTVDFKNIRSPTKKSSR